MAAGSEEMMQRDYRTACSWHLVWLCVFAANLLLAILLGSELDRDVQAGMSVGVAVWWIVSHLMFDQIHYLRGALIYGGICVALSQVGLVMHLVAGVAAARIITTLFDVQGGSFAAGFWLTIFTGGELMLIAILLGSSVLKKVNMNQR